MRDKLLIGLVTGTVILTMAGLANATPYGYNFTISGDSNIPTFTLTNAGSIDITGYSLTIGDLDYNWDAVYHESGDSVGFSLISGDTDDGAPGWGGVRVDIFEYVFTTFTAGKIFIHEADVDIDSFNINGNYKSTLFNNGTAANALLTVYFLNADMLSMTLPDNADNLSSYSFNQKADTSPVPEPATMLLFGTGLVGLVGSKLRRKKK